MKISNEEVLKVICDDDITKMRELFNEGLSSNMLLSGKSLLMVAAEIGSLNMVSFLISKVDIDIICDEASDGCDYRGWNALHFACKSGDFQKVEKLLFAGCDVRDLTDQGLSPYNIFMHSDFENVNIDDEKHQNKPLTSGELMRTIQRLCYRNDYFKDEDVMHYLLSSKPTRRKVDAIKKICELGYDVNKCISKTPLHLACEYVLYDSFCGEVIDTLVTYGADPFLKGDYISAYEYCIVEETRKWMIERMLGNKDAELVF